MKKGLLVIPVAGAVATVVALGVTSIKPWSWESTASKHEINYCLLIGQTDHNDSQARTAGVRNALKTRPEKTSNPNTESPVQGKLTFELDSNGEKVTYVVNELAHKVCISESGAKWDQTTALNMCNTWYSKYQNNITMIVSNNDGMAEGALYSANRPEGMPIFGYDSNESTLGFIEENKIKGTVNSNAPAQAAACNLLACRILDGTYDGNEDNIYSQLFKGLKVYDKNDTTTVKTDKAGADDYIVNGEYLTDILGTNAVDYYYDKTNHSLVVNSCAVDETNAKTYRELKHKDQANNAHVSNSLSQVIKTRRQAAQGKTTYSFFQNTYSKTDTYLQSTFIPLIKDFREMMGINSDTITDGNGNEEDPIIDAITNKGAQDAYIINMTKTTSAELYINKIHNKVVSEKGEDAYKKTPIIFYNRQPTNEDNKPDATYMISGKANFYNPYVFYVGFDADKGAEIQGKLITDWLQKQIGGKIVEE